MLAMTLVVLAMGTYVLGLVREQPPVTSGDQTNIATFALAKYAPGVLVGDFVYGAGNPSSFYTPWQTDLAWWLRGVTGSWSGAFGVQLPPILLLSLSVAALAGWWLTGQFTIGAVLALVLTAPRGQWLGSDVWGVGGFDLILPRTWAGALVVAPIAIWFRAVQHSDWRLLPMAGALTGVLVNIHPPTGIPTCIAMLLASAVDQLLRVRSGSTAWRWWVAQSLATALGAAPFLVNYLAVGAANAPIQDFESYLAAVRYRVGQWTWPQVLTLIQEWRVIRGGERELLERFSLVIASGTSAVVLLRDSSGRKWLRAGLLLAGGLLVGSVLLPIVAQAWLIHQGRSPIPAIDLIRGARVGVPLMLLTCVLAISVLLRRRGAERMAAIPLALLVVTTSFAEPYLPLRTVSAWGVPATIGLVVVVGASLAAAPLVGRLLGGSAGAWVPPLLIVGVAMLAPLTAPPSAVALTQAAVADADVEDMLRWARTLPWGAVIETSATKHNAAQRLRTEALHPITLTWKDGGVLIYADPPRAVRWHLLTLRAQAAIATGDFPAMETIARELGASLILVDRQVWLQPLPGRVPVWQNSRFVAYPGVQ